jgi:hypothetical protein
LDSNNLETGEQPTKRSFHASFEGAQSGYAIS